MKHIWRHRDRHGMKGLIQFMHIMRTIRQSTLRVVCVRENDDRFYQIQFSRLRSNFVMIQPSRVQNLYERATNADLRSVYSRSLFLVEDQRELS